jgi:hypothetical protein
VKSFLAVLGNYPINEQEASDALKQAGYDAEIAFDKNAGILREPRFVVKH